MNRKLTIHILGMLMLIEAAAMVPSVIVALCTDGAGLFPLLQAILLLCVLGVPAMTLARPEKMDLRAREGFLIVALSWVLLSAFGGLPLLFSGVMPNFFDAFFEAVSGFTTTGATVLTNFDTMPPAIAFWRCFTHWIGGMGVLVLTLAILPKMSGRTSHLVRAESPGLSVTKVVPKMGDTAKILYLIYLGLTAAEFFALWIAGMAPFDALLHAISTAGTGGFSNKAGSIADFNSPAIEAVITVFMILFGVNFALYYKMLTGGWKEAFHSEELHWFLGIVGASILILTLMLVPYYGGFGSALRYSSFNTATILSTTGFGTADFNLWPLQARGLLMLLMFFGSCAGSTAGGLKIVRVGLLVKNAKREISRTFRPGKVEVVRFEGKRVEENVLSQVSMFFFVYVALIIIGAFVISFDGYCDYETSFTAALTCVSNVGPGLSGVGPASNFAAYSPFSKVVLSFLMLCGRLELYPILVLLHPDIWRKY